MPSQAGQRIEIQLLDESAAEGNVAEVSVGGLTRRRLIALTLIVLTAIALVLASRSDSEQPSDSDKSAQVTGEQGLAGQADSSVDADASGVWPAPPADHDPHVAEVPGKGIPLLGTEQNLTLIYVSIREQATVVDLDTGTVFWLDVAAGRSYDRFMVEFGQIVTTDLNDRDLEFASARALGVNVYQSVPGSNAAEQPVNHVQPLPGLNLCLSPGGCQRFHWTARALDNDVDAASLLTADNYPEINALLKGSSWVVADDWLVASASELDGARIPAPRDETIWVLHQPVDES